MKALIYRRFGPPDVLEWVDDWPDPVLGNETVLVETVAGSINPKDVLLRKGKFSRTLARDPLPRVSGLDISGRVAAVGSGVSGFAIGDPVFGMTNRFCGGVHAEVASLHSSELRHAPSSISLETAASVPLAAQTALQGLRDYCGLAEGQRILIIGASGGVGHFAVQIARVLGAEVHAVCGPTNVAFVQSLGAAAVYDYTERPAPSIPARFDAVFDVFGKYTRSTFTQQLAGGGVFVSTVPKLATLAAELVAATRLSRRSRLVFVKSRADDLTQLANWIDDGRIAPHVERIYPVTEAADAHRHVETKHTVGKVCITF